MSTPKIPFCDALEPLSQGSQALIYKARRKGVPVVVKMLKNGASSGDLKRLEYEYWVLKNRPNPTFVAVLDFGVTEYGEAYLVEEYVDGIDLVSFCVERPFAEIAPLLLSLIEALAYLEHWKMTHGDLKPAHILVCGHKNPTLKIIDFGLAQGVDHANAGGVSGSVAYMAPEVLNGGAPDFFSEAYSLGVMIYEALAGGNPFADRTLSVTVQNHLLLNPPYIGFKRPDVPKDWAQVIMSLLKKNKYERLTSFDVLLLFLGGSKNQHQGLQVSGDSLQDIAYDRASKRLLTLNDPLFEYWIPQVAEGRAHKYQVMGLCALEATSYEESLRYFTAAAELFGDSIDGIKSQNYFSYASLMLGDLAGAENHFLKIRPKIEALTEDQKILITNFDLALVYKAQKKWMLASDLIRSEVARYVSFLPQLDGRIRTLVIKRMANLYYQLAQIFAETGDSVGAEEAYSKSFEYADLSYDLALMMRCKNGLANLYQKNSKQFKALGAYEEALDMAKALGDYQGVATLFYNRGLIEKDQRQLDKAQESFRQAVLFGEKSSSRHPFIIKVVALSCVERALLISAKDPELVVELFQRALALLENHESLKEVTAWVLRQKIAFCKQTKRPYESDLIRLQVLSPETDTTAVESSEYEQRGSKVHKTGDVILTEASFAQRLLQINQDLLSEMPFDSLLGRVLWHALQITDAELAVVLKVNDQGELKALKSQNAPLDAPLSEISVGVSRKVLESGDVVVVHDAPHDIAWQAHQSVVALKIKSVMGIPLMHASSIWGVLYLSTKQKLMELKPELVTTLRLMGQQLGVALKIQELLSQLAQKNKLISEELSHSQVMLRVRESELANYRTIQKRGGLVYVSEKMDAVLTEARMVAPSLISVVIKGETGVGKEFMARYIHDESNQKGPFVAINCGAIPKDLVEGELFGVKKGAFTGADRDKPGLVEAAHEGTLFLDEIADLPLEAQTKLLRVLQEGEVRRVGDTVSRKISVRVVAATHKDLSVAVSSKKFREDLYYRLVGYELAIPSLRDRIEDIPALVSKFIADMKEENPKQMVEDLDSVLMNLLMKHSWPGNVRELRQFVAVAALFGRKKRLGHDELPDQLKAKLSNKKLFETTAPVQVSNKTWKQYQKEYLQEALATHDGSIPLTSKSIGVSQGFLYQWQKNHRIKKGRPKEVSFSYYQNGSTLAGFQSRIFSSIHKQVSRQAKAGAKILGVSMATYYKWTRNDKNS